MLEVEWEDNKVEKKGTGRIIRWRRREVSGIIPTSTTNYKVLVVAVAVASPLVMVTTMGTKIY